jgi:hypothetical protein
MREDFEVDNLLRDLIGKTVDDIFTSNEDDDTNLVIMILTTDGDIFNITANGSEDVFLYANKYKELSS